MDDLFKNEYRLGSTRLKEWDYSSNGYYFVTICVRNRECVFGYVNNGEMTLSEIGSVAEKCWLEIPGHFTFVKLDGHVNMPNHVHGIVIINNNDNIETQNLASLHKGNRFGPQSRNLGSVVRGFKIGVKKWKMKNNMSFEWQPRFHDRIIHDEKESLDARNHILNNPFNWEEDKEYVKT